MAILSNRVPTRVLVSISANESAKKLQQKFVGLGTLGSIYRIAALISLRQNGYLEDRPNDMDTAESDRIQARLPSPLEIYSGGRPILFPTLVQLVAERPLTAEEIYRQVSYHIHLGCALLEKLAEQAGTFEELYALLLDKVPAGLYEVSSDSFIDSYEGNGLRLKIGENLSDNSEIHWQINDTSVTANPHACIVGVSGQGKTEFTLDLLYQIREQNQDVSFTVLDYKGDLSDPGSPKRRMFESHLGCRTVTAGSDPIPTVPFQNISGYDSEQYALGVADLMKEFYPRIGGQQRLALQNCISELISKREFSEGFGFQTLEDYLYEEREGKADGLTEAISNLRVLRAFEETPSTNAPTSLIASSLLIRLSELIADTLPVAFLVIKRLYDEMKQLPDAERQGSIADLRHIIFIDEAHHYLSVKASPLARIIREGRSKGVAVLLATQSVSDLGRSDADYREFLSNAFFFKTNLNRAQDIRALVGQQASRVADQIADLETGQMLFNNNLQRNLKASILQASQFYRRGL